MGASDDRTALHNSVCTMNSPRMNSNIIQKGVTRAMDVLRDQHNTREQFIGDFRPSVAVCPITSCVDINTQVARITARAKTGQLRAMVGEFNVIPGQ